MKRYYLLHCNDDLYTIRSEIRLPFICYIAVADRFTKTEKTYIQVTLPLCFFLNCATLLNTYLIRRNRVCNPTFSKLTFNFVFSISKGTKKHSFVEMLGGMVAISQNVIVCPYIISFHMILTELLAIRQPFWITKWSPLLHFQTI